MNNQKKALLVALAVAGVSVSGPMVKWSLSCGASPVMIAFGRMALSFALLLIPALKSGELQAVVHAPKSRSCWPARQDCCSRCIIPAG